MSDGLDKSSRLQIARARAEAEKKQRVRITPRFPGNVVTPTASFFRGN